MKRSEQKLIPGPIEGYKIVNENMTCSVGNNSFTFQMGMNELPGDNPLKLCNFGFHFCAQPSGPWSYHPTGRLFKVKAYDVLEEPFAPGTDFKMCCARLEFVEEINVDGNLNTGNLNTGDQNTGDQNTGHWNTGNLNTGHRNTGDQNTGDWNTGDWNTGDGNCGNYHSGYFNTGEAPLYIFGKICKIERSNLPHYLMEELSGLLIKDGEFDPTPFLKIPNATAEKILSLHKTHIEARKTR